MKFENTEVFNFEGAIRGMRNPLESWGKSDSAKCFSLECENCNRNKLDCSNVNGCDYIVGNNDLSLMHKLIKAGSEHRKFIRQIFVSVDITAPIYWWKEFDTYKIGTVANSTSTMHKLASTPITIDCFEFNCDVVIPIFNVYVETLETMRQEYNKTKNKEIWKTIIQMLPESWLQKRTVTMNYENILNMVHQRKNHKLSEWSTSFIEWARSLPYAEELLFVENHNDKRKDN